MSAFPVTFSALPDRGRLNSPNYRSPCSLAGPGVPISSTHRRTSATEHTQSARDARAEGHQHDGRCGAEPGELDALALRVPDVHADEHLLLLCLARPHGDMVVLDAGRAEPLAGEVFVVRTGEDWWSNGCDAWTTVGKLRGTTRRTNPGPLRAQDRILGQAAWTGPPSAGYKTQSASGVGVRVEAGAPG